MAKIIITVTNTGSLLQGFTFCRDDMTEMTISKSIFICGTDTGVGKTVVTGTLAAWFNSQGIRCGAYKPVESGGRRDARYLKKMASMKEALDEINPYYFREPLAPAVAAQREGKKISFETIRKNLKKLRGKYDLVLIEGAGGLLATIAGLKTNLDLIKYLKTPVVLVGKSGLGTINHSLLTWHHLKRNRVPVLGLILNRNQRQKTAAERNNPVLLKKFGIQILGIHPFLDNP